MWFDNQIEHNDIAKKIGDAIRTGRVSHAYIIEGDSLSGKKEFALEFAKAAVCIDKPGTGCNNCRNCRLMEMGAYRDLYVVSGDDRSVKDKDIEELQDRLNQFPLEEGRRNIAIIEDADTMTPRAQNRFLKTLEEPFPGTIIMLLSENSDSLLQTVRSRCQVIRLLQMGTVPFEKSGEDSDSQFPDMAKSLLGRIARGGYYFELKKDIDNKIKTKKDALSLLDALERELRTYMIWEKEEESEEETEPPFTPEFAIHGIQCVEEARKYIRYNIKEKNALNELMLKIGG